MYKGSCLLYFNNRVTLATCFFCNINLTYPIG